MSTTSRSIRVWTVIVLTLCGAVYYGWAVIFSLNLIASARPLKESDYYAYAPGTAVALFLLFAAIAVYRGHRWSLFLYQLVLVYLALQVLLYLPGLWQVVSQFGTSSSGHDATNAAFWLTMFSPLLMFVAAFFSAVVIYREIYSKKHPDKRLQDDAPELRAPAPRP